MSIRIRIAKWLAPELANWHATAEKWEEATYKWINLATMFEKRANVRERALLSIARLRTPKCSHVVKKACSIADQALSGEG
jgi:hypothetical protein